MRRLVYGFPASGSLLKVRPPQDQMPTGQPKTWLKKAKEAGAEGMRNILEIFGNFFTCLWRKTHLQHCFLIQKSLINRGKLISKKFH